MRILGWILTVIGGMLSFGAVISSRKAGFILDAPTLVAIAVSIGLFILGILILNSTSKKQR